MNHQLLMRNRQLTISFKLTTCICWLTDVNYCDYLFKRQTTRANWVGTQPNLTSKWATWPRWPPYFELITSNFVVFNGNCIVKEDISIKQRWNIEHVSTKKMTQLCHSHLKFMPSRRWFKVRTFWMLVFVLFSYLI